MNGYGKPKTGKKKPKPKPKGYVSFILMCLLSFLPLLGCAQSASARWAQQRESLTTAQNIMSDLAEQGKLSPSEIVEADVGFKAVRAHLELAEQTLGDPNATSTFESNLSMARDLLLKMREMLEARQSSETTRKEVLLERNTIDSADRTRYGSDFLGIKSGRYPPCTRSAHRRAIGTDQVPRQLQRLALGCGSGQSQSRIGQRLIVRRC
jgi:hypothetical protein